MSYELTDEQMAEYVSAEKEGYVTYRPGLCQAARKKLLVWQEADCKDPEHFTEGLSWGSHWDCPSCMVPVLKAHEVSDTP